MPVAKSSDSPLQAPVSEKGYTGAWLRWIWIATFVVILLAWSVLAVVVWERVQSAQGHLLQSHAIALARTADLQLSAIRTGMTLVAEGGVPTPKSLARLLALEPGIDAVAYLSNTASASIGVRGFPFTLIQNLAKGGKGLPLRSAQQAALQRCLSSRAFCIGPLLQDPQIAEPSSRWGFPVFQPVLARSGQQAEMLLGWVRLSNSLFPAWRSLAVDQQGAVFLLRNDGMLLTRYPYSAQTDYAAVQTGTVVRHWLRGGATQQASFAGYSSAAHAWRMCAVHPLPQFALLAGQCIPRQSLLAAWWRSMRWPSWVGLLLLLLANVGYFYLGRQHRVHENLRRNAEFDVWEAKERAEVTLHSIGDAVITTDHQGLVTQMNPVAEQLTGWTLADAQGQALENVFHIVSEDDGREVSSPATMALREKKIVGLANHTILVARDGTRRNIEDSAAPILDRSGQVLGVVLVFHDITERFELLERLSYQATHDVLTGLPNRALFAERMQQAKLRADRGQTLLVIGLLDLDGFKLINDRLGHAVGDLVLKTVAQRIRTELRAEDTLCRFGGDEFAFLSGEIKQIAEVELLLQRLLTVVGQPLELEGEYLLPAASIGVAIYPLDSAEALEDLVRHADLALYTSKRSLGNHWTIFSWEMEEQQQHRLHGEELLEMALTHDHLRLYYQPVVDVDKGLIGAEALLRLEHPSRGLLSPKEFFEGLDAPKLAQRIGRFVLHHALMQLRDWLLHEKLDIKLSINVSASYLLHPDFLDDLRQIIAKYPEIPRDYLIMEITETAPMIDFEKAKMVLAACQEMGCQISLDDFGTGSASLTYLQKLPVDSIKIDQSFVRDMLEDSKDYAIVAGVVYSAEIMNLRVVAEGVESEGQVRALQNLHCTLLQGYYYAQPLAPPQFAQWCANFRSARDGESAAKP
jgi:diguanylate cyclase (GGDEF)-like protein/PAS domain S-box-containing protein